MSPLRNDTCANKNCFIFFSYFFSFFFIFIGNDYNFINYSTTLHGIIVERSNEILSKIALYNDSQSLHFYLFQFKFFKQSIERNLYVHLTDKNLRCYFLDKFGSINFF